MSDLLQIAQELSKQPYLGEVSEVISLAPDVSSRRYHRVQYKSGEVRSALLAELPKDTREQNKAFVTVQSFFQSHGIRVPQLYADAVDDDLLLLEDLGDTALWQAVIKAKEDQIDPLIQTKEDPAQGLMEKALVILRQLQSLSPPEDGTNTIFRRSPSFEVQQAGPREFVQFIMSQHSISSSQEEVFEEFTSQLAEEICSHRKVVSHYDFISHNIHVLPDNELAVIDFQDTCLDSPVRDLHALLCDRGMDEILGSTRLTSLLLKIFEEDSDPKEFRQMYCEYAVHWDMRVSGRFTKLAKVDGRKKYAQWIDGTVARVVRGLEKLSDKFPRGGDVLEIILAKIPEAKEMAQEECPVPDVAV